MEDRRHPGATPVGEGDFVDHVGVPPHALVSAAVWRPESGYEDLPGTEGLPQVEWVERRRAVRRRRFGGVQSLLTKSAGLLQLP